MKMKVTNKLHTAILPHTPSLQIQKTLYPEHMPRVELEGKSFGSKVLRRSGFLPRDGTSAMLFEAARDPQTPFQQVVSRLHTAGGRASITELAEQTGVPREKIEQWGTLYEGVFSVREGDLECDRLSPSSAKHQKITP